MVMICQLVLQPWVSLGLLYNPSPTGVMFLNKIICYRMGLYPHPGGPGSLLVWTLPFDLTGMGVVMIYQTVKVSHPRKLQS
jgi:hypothetical protein